MCVPYAGEVDLRVLKKLSSFTSKYHLPTSSGDLTKCRNCPGAECAI